MNRCVAKSHILFNSGTTKTLDDFNLIMIFISDDFIKVGLTRIAIFKQVFNCKFFEKSLLETILLQLFS